MKIAVSISEADLNRAIASYSDRLNNLEPALRSFAEYKLLEIRRQFDSESDPDGRPWLPLHPRTIKQKQRKGRNNGILKATRALRDTFTYSVSQQSLTIGTPRKYARFHQQGEGVPERRILGINPQDRRELLAELKEHVSAG
jgi:phage virion morphogenesis protein